MFIVPARTSTSSSKKREGRSGFIFTEVTKFEQIPDFWDLIFSKIERIVLLGPKNGDF